MPHLRVFRTGAHAQMASTRGEAHECFERLRHVRLGETEVAVAALLLGCQQAAVDQAWPGACWRSAG
jgi:hypothetical protein